MKNVIRSNLDYYLYLFKIKFVQAILFLIDLVVFVVVLLLTLNDVESVSFYHIVLIILTLLSVFFYILSSFEKIKQIFLLKPIHSITIEDNNVSKDILSCNNESNGYEKIEYLKLLFISSNTVDNNLIDENLSYEIVKQKKEIVSRIRRNDIAFFTFLKKIKSEMSTKQIPLINEQKYSLYCDIELNTNHKVKINKSTYFDSILSNTIAGKRVIENDNGNQIVLFDGKSLSPIYMDLDKNCFIKNIENSMMNNHVGVSTIALTTDRKLVLFTQGDSLVDANKVVSSGNGSADWKDINNTDKDFAKLIKKSMVRELVEECGISRAQIPQLIDRTMIIGYFRWIMQMGKPQFVGLTKLNSSYSDIIPKEGLKKLYETKYPIELNVKNVDDLIEIIQNLENLHLSNEIELNASLIVLLWKIKNMTIEKSPIIDKWLSIDIDI